MSVRSGRGIDLKQAAHALGRRSGHCLSHRSNGSRFRTRGTRLYARPGRRRRNMVPPRGLRLKKFRGQQIVERIGRTRRYEARLEGLKAINALIVLRDKAINRFSLPPRKADRQRAHRTRHRSTRHYDAIRTAMRGVFHELGIAA